ncbi:hypothetical protein GH714_028980 [Hevea brasiliensis]|uniref:DUF4378 domain-containing protein n=1 Tax=Hevea brasiliensis TaxID=3981 RepID=A0A6A6KJJ5_HEVBR|nr:hypothetical protein GH714_028980 [Hevea brasiliensis]
MEAAGRIIEPCPQATAKAKIPMVGSPSVPLKVRNLKEKLEVAQKMPLVGSSAASLKARNLKEKVEAPNKTPRFAEPSTRRPVESNAAKYLKGQSLNKSWNGSVDTTSFRAFPEIEEGSSGLKNKGKSISLAIQAKVNVQKRESLNSSGSRGLVSDKDHSEVMSSQTFKGQLNMQKSLLKKSYMHNASGVLRPNNQKQNCHMEKDKPSKKLGSDVIDSEKGLSNYSTKNIPRKKRSIDGNLHLEKNHIVDNMLIDKNQKEIESNRAIDRHFNWAEESKKKGMDVVSFTFTAPLMRYMPGYETSGQVQKSGSVCMDDQGKRLLLDTDGNTTPRSFDNKDQNMLLGSKSGSSRGSNVFSTDPTALRLKHRKLLDCRHPSPVSVLEPSFSTESSSSLDSTDCSSAEGSKQCSSIQAQEILGLSSSKKFHSVDAIKIYQILLLQNLLEFALGWAREIVSPLLFNRLESQKGGLVNGGVEARLERKGEMVRRKEWLAEEVLKEISAWKGMGDCMVDELVDKDMSTQYGRWLDFEVDAFLLGTDIEGQIYSCLLDEVVVDFFRS